MFSKTAVVKIVRVVQDAEYINPGRWDASDKISSALPICVVGDQACSTRSLQRTDSQWLHKDARFLVSLVFTVEHMQVHDHRLDILPRYLPETEKRLSILWTRSISCEPQRSVLEADMSTGDR